MREWAARGSLGFGRWSALVAALIGLALGAPRTVWGGAAEVGGVALEGMHVVGQGWVDSHGEYAEVDLRPCRVCHGADLVGTAASRTAADRMLDADDFGRKLFWRGFQVGCYACHDGPQSQSPTANSPPRVADASLHAVAGSAAAAPIAVMDVDGNSTQLRVVTPPEHGLARIEGGQVVYAAAAEFSGEDEFSIAAWDGLVDSNLAVVLVTVVAAEEFEPTPCPGDCDGNGQVEIGELIGSVRRALAGSGGCDVADIDGNGVIGVGELVAAVGAALHGCAVISATPTMTEVGATPTPFPAPSFAALQLDIFSPSCATAFCHDALGGAGGLILEPGVAYAQLVGVAASNGAARAEGLSRVAAGDPLRSFLLVKLLGPAAEQGAPMPLGQLPLSATDIEKVRAWIAAGALP